VQIKDGMAPYWQASEFIKRSEVPTQLPPQRRPFKTPPSLSDSLGPQWRRGGEGSVDKRWNGPIFAGCIKTTATPSSASWVMIIID